MAVPSQRHPIMMTFRRPSFVSILPKKGENKHMAIEYPENIADVLSIEAFFYRLVRIERSY